MTHTIDADCTPLNTSAAPDDPHQPPRHRNGWLTAGSAALSIVVIAAVTGVLAADTSPVTRPTEPLAAAVASSTPSPGDNKPPPSPHAVPPHTVQASALAALGGRLRASAVVEAQGRYTYVSVEQWFGQGDGIVPMREQRWFDTQTRRSYSARLTLPTVSPAQFRPEMVGRSDFAAAEYSDAQYLMPLRSMPTPLSDDPAGLRRILQADIGGQPLSGPGMISFIVGLSTNTHPPAGVRAAALELLATLDGLSVTDNATDALGRTGIGITATSSEQTVTVVIDAATGLALAHEAHLRAGPGSLTSSSWGLIMANSRTDTPDLPTS